MNYKEMSDLQINLLVANAIGVDAVGNSGVVFGVVRHEGDNVISVIGVVDYCNNPSDAWPVVISHGISIAFDVDELSGAAWVASHWSCDLAYCDTSNPLRAAMIMFLMMQERDK